jgi:5-hydroxyisourate hydrolase
VGRLTTHVLDTVRGGPAAGMRIDLSRLDADARVLVATVRSNAQGRTDAALLEGDTMQRGEFELLFHVGEYFRGCGAALADPAFLDCVPIRFGIADPSAHYHVPLLCTPWSYATYRGS